MLRTRLITAALLLAGFLPALFLLPPLAWQILATLAILAAAWEWSRLAGYSRMAMLAFMAPVAGECLFLVASGAWRDEWIRLAHYALSAAFWLLLVPMWLANKWTLRRPLLAAAVGWVVLVPAWLALIDLHRLGGMALLAILTFVWIADIAAYFTGRSLGRNKLAPAISPGKTWEGAAGAVIGVAAYFFYLRGALPAQLASWPVLAGLALFLTAVSIIGDLFESLIKRQAGVKDSSNLLPGHGGVLDRIDSLTSTLPLAALLSMYC